MLNYKPVTWPWPNINTQTSHAWKSTMPSNHSAVLTKSQSMRYASKHKPTNEGKRPRGSLQSLRFISRCFSGQRFKVHHHHHNQSLNREGRWGTTNDFATSFLHFPLFSAALWDLPNSRLVHSLMLSSHLFLCLPCLLPPFIVPCKMVLAKPVERETRAYYCRLRLFMTVSRSLCGPVARWILARTSSLVTWSLYRMCSILR